MGRSRVTIIFMSLVRSLVLFGYFIPTLCWTWTNDLRINSKLNFASINFIASKKFSVKLYSQKSRKSPKKAKKNQRHKDNCYTAPPHFSPFPCLKKTFEGGHRKSNIPSKCFIRWIPKRIFYTIINIPLPLHSFCIEGGDNIFKLFIRELPEDFTDDLTNGGMGEDDLTGIIDT